jgi:hypothetical protein
MPCTSSSGREDEAAHPVDELFADDDSSPWPHVGDEVACRPTVPSVTHARGRGRRLSATK